MACQAYEPLAPIYDRLMAHVEYDKWVILIYNVLDRYRPKSSKPPFVFELGGGTGVLGSTLSADGVHYIGSDLSPAMTVQARRRGLPVVCCNGLSLGIRAQFDLALFLFDAINYLSDLTAYTTLFTEVHSILAPNGLFLFDITTDYNSITNFMDCIDYDDFGDHVYYRHSYYDAVAHRQFNEFTLFKRTSTESPEGTKSPEGAQLYERYDEFHAQQLFGVKEIMRAIPAELFETIGIWDNFSMKRYNARSERIHFLLRKRSS